MKYEVVDYNWKTLRAHGNERNEDGRDREVCNLDEGNQHPKDQEDFTRISPRKMWRLGWKSKRMRTLNNKYHWEMCQHVWRMIDTYKKMSLEGGHHQKVICDLFWCLTSWKSLGMCAGSRKEELWRMSQLCTLWSKAITVEGRRRQMSLWRKPQM